MCTIFERPAAAVFVTKCILSAYVGKNNDFENTSDMNTIFEDLQISRIFVFFTTIPNIALLNMFLYITYTYTLYIACEMFDSAQCVCMCVCVSFVGRCCPHNSVPEAQTICIVFERQAGAAFRNGKC